MGKFVPKRSGSHHSRLPAVCSHEVSKEYGVDDFTAHTHQAHVIS
jgi:hypothetical protein